MVAPVLRPNPWLIATLLTIGSVLLRPAPAAADPQGIKFFETKIRPVLAMHCYKCHGAKKQESELRLDTYLALIKGGATGPAVAPNEPDQSLLIHAIEYEDEELQMPPKRRLAEQVIKDFKHWINIGAPHPDANKRPATTADNPDPDKPLWSLQKLQRSPLPAIQNTTWPTNSIDHYVLAQLEARGLQPAPVADKSTLIRRLALDLTGLPPSTDQVREFLADPSPQAYCRLIDTLLASPAYGERWGRHWLDVARYADSNGLDENIAHGNAWRYRDYVIQAFNTDKPFDHFIHEQLAGDLLPDKVSAQQRAARLTATGFLALGPKVLAEGDVQKMEMDIIDEQIDTIGRAFMGLTFGCARCHDHKFDPISTEDYYGLAGILKSTRTMESFKRIARWHENPLASAKEQQAHQQRTETITKLKAQIKQLTDEANKQLSATLKAGTPLPKDAASKYPAATRKQLADLEKQRVKLEKKTPELPTAMGVQDQEVQNVKVHIRGSYLKLGKEVPRRVPEMFVSATRPVFPPDQSGRLQLASWLTTSDHPLTSRVIANRVWRWHFGRGLVAATDNFGHLGNLPTHPKLLDHLALGLMDRQWSIKRLHRWIVSSSTYQMSSRHDAKAIQVDPENRLWWRFDIRRLEAESLRDTLLATSGLLDRRSGGSMLHVANREFFFDHTSIDKTNYKNHRRSVYLPVVRNNLYEMFQLFDYNDASVLNGNRNTSTVAPQALFLMNSSFMQEVTEQLARQLKSSTSFSQTITTLYQRIYARSPSPAELQRCQRYLDAFRNKPLVNTTDPAAVPMDPEFRAWQSLCHVLLMSNEFIYVK